MTAISIDPRLWPRLHPLLIAHDVGGSRDRSTAVVGGYCGYAPGILGIKEFSELPQDLYGSMRASALAQVDARYDRNALIVADLSNDSSYGEQLLETFGPRVIGVHIGPRGDGMTSVGGSAQRFASGQSLLCGWPGGTARLCPTGSPRARNTAGRDDL